MTRATACPSRGQGDSSPARKPPSQSQAPTRKYPRGSALVGGQARGLSPCCRFPGTVLWKLNTAEGWGGTLPGASHAWPGGCRRLRCGPCSAWLPEQGAAVPSPRQSQPAGPHQGRGGEESLVSRVGREHIKIFLPVLGWQLPHHTTAGMGLGNSGRAVRRLLLKRK